MSLIKKLVITGIIGFAGTLSASSNATSGKIYDPKKAYEIYMGRKFPKEIPVFKLDDGTIIYLHKKIDEDGKIRYDWEK